MLRQATNVIDLEEAIVAAGYLNANGVSAYLMDFQYASIEPLQRIAIGGCRIGVPKSEVETARELLAPIDRSLGVEMEGLVCNRCGGERFARVKPLVLPLLLLYFWGHPIWWRTNKVRCVHCRREMKNDERRQDVT